jgi:hypothetical protein
MGTAAHCTQLPRNAGNIVSVPHFSWKFKKKICIENLKRKF